MKAPDASPTASGRNDLEHCVDREQDHHAEESREWEVATIAARASVGFRSIARTHDEFVKCLKTDRDRTGRLGSTSEGSPGVTSIQQRSCSIQ
jgi:hypothetical protein